MAIETFLAQRVPALLLKHQVIFFSLFSTFVFCYLTLDFCSHAELARTSYSFSYPACSSQIRRTHARKPHPKIKSKQAAHGSHQLVVLSDSIAILQQNWKYFASPVGSEWLFEGTERPHTIAKTEQVKSISLAKDFPRCCHRLIWGEVPISTSSIPPQSLAPLNVTISAEFFPFCPSIPSSKQWRTLENLAGPSPLSLH